MARRVATALVLVGLPAGGAVAQPASELPADASEPGPPRLSARVDLSVTFGPDDPYWFNYTDYGQNALRLFIGVFGASYRVTSWLEGVGEARVENDDRARLSALYARVRPWRDHPLTVAAGRVPPVFGAFARSRYGNDNPLISRPLAYQYLNTLRYDVVPISTDSLLAVRGEGWYFNYPEAQPPNPIVPAQRAPGVPLVSSSRWDTGLVAGYETSVLHVTGGVTVGTLSDPRVDDNNGGKQLVARVEWRPDAAWTIGASAAGGAFVSRDAAHQAGAGDTTWPQRAIGVDAAFARGHLSLRGEAIVTSWRIPSVAAPYVDEPLGATSATLEAVYRVTPRLDVAARGDWVGFSEIQGTLHGGRPTSWDANVARVEAGVNVRLARRVRVKVVYQLDWRFGDHREREGYPAVQLVTWF
jgi:hypothetical protein